MLGKQSENFLLDQYLLRRLSNTPHIATLYILSYKIMQLVENTPVHLQHTISRGHCDLTDNLLTQLKFRIGYF